MKRKVISPVTQSEKEHSEEERYLQSIVRPDVQIELLSIHHGFPSVESVLSRTVNAAELTVELLHQDLHNTDGIFINCFDDPGVTACREALDVPVFGGYIPSMLTVLSLGERIGIVTTDPRCVANEARKAKEHGFDRSLVGIDYIQTPIVDLLSDKRSLITHLADACQHLYRESGADAVCLGCTVMSRVWQELRDELKRRQCPINVVDPLRTGLFWLENMVSLQYTNSFRTNLTLGALQWAQQ